MITLYYIPGISRSDTPVFSSITSQESYFNRKTPTFINKIDIESGFYPPNYRNSIDISIDDVNDIYNCNYLSLEFNHKTYYYFIDSIVYVNESLVTLYVTMDTIQTFMFDVRFHKYERTRKLIQRWVNSKINRDYLRENVSQGLFQQYKRKNYINRTDWDYAPYGDSISGLYVIKYSNKSAEWEKPCEISLDIEIPSKPKSYGFSSYYLYVLPEIGHRLKNEDSNILFPNTTVTKNFFSCVNESSKDPNAVEIYYVPFCNISGLSGSAQGITPDSQYSFLGNRGFTTQKENVQGADIYLWTARVIYDTQFYGFAVSPSESTLFDSAYCPQLLDENYVRLAFGESDAQATYPLYMSKVDNFKCLYYGDIMTGSRYYNILDNDIFTELGYLSINNKYNTSAVATVPNYIDMVTDSWKQWWAYNKGALITAIGTTVLKMISSYVYAGVEAAALAEEAAITTKYTSIKMNDAIDAGDWDARYNLALANDQYLDMNSARQSAAYGRAGARAVSSGNSIITLAASAVNAVFQPNSPKTQGTLWANTYSGKTQISTIWQRVNDIEECARYFETNGYKVHEVISNPISYLNPELPWKRTRYYYDIVSCNNIILSCSGTLLPAVLEDDLRSRLQEGFRAWHCYEGQAVYPYIELRNLIIGSTCVYDNKEI